MRNSLRRTLIGAATLAALGLAALAAAGLPKLPADRALPKGQDSPGVVVFSHASHVDAKRPDCTTCHPGLFKILQRGTPVQGGPHITHEHMEAGRQCGACHDGKSAHGFEDCAACHRDE